MFIVKFIFVLSLVINLSNCFGNENYTKCDSDAIPIALYAILVPPSNLSDKEKAEHQAVGFFLINDCLTKEKEK